VLTQFQNHPDAWLKVDAILDKSKFTHTKVFLITSLPKWFKWFDILCITVIKNQS
jgi:hypothetical protein